MLIRETRKKNKSTNAVIVELQVFFLNSKMKLGKLLVFLFPQK